MDRKLASKNLRLAAIVGGVAALLFAFTFVIAAAYIS